MDSLSGQTEFDTIIVGAGLAGLAAAWELRSRKIVVLESETRTGGRLRSETRNPYWLNLGAGVFSATPSPVRQLIEEMGLETVEIPGSTTAVGMSGRVVKSGRIESYPLRLPLTVSARASLVRAGLRIRLAVARYHRLGQKRPGETDEEVEARLLKFEGDRSFADFLGRVHPDVDALMRATAAQRIGTESETISANGALGSFAYQWSGGKSILNHNLSGGSGLLPEALTARLGSRVCTGCPVHRIVRDESGVTITATLNGVTQDVRAKTAIIATPADVTRNIAEGLPASLDSALGEIRYGAAVLAAMLTNETAAMPYDDIYAMITPKAFSTVFINVASSLRTREPRLPGGSILLYQGGDRARHLLGASNAEIQARMLESFDGLFPGAARSVTEILVQRWPRIVPFARPGRHLLQPTLCRDLGRLALAGDYLGGWGNMETAVSTGIQAAARVSRYLDA